MKIFQLLAFALLLAIPIGIKSQSAAAQPAPSDTAALRQAYADAIRNAIYPNRDKISQDLVPLVPDNQKLSWNDDHSRVLMVTWTKSSYFKDYKKDSVFNLYGATWLTAFPYGDEFLKAWSANNACDSASLGLRINQLLGIPPTNTNNVFVYFWVKPEDIFRPCPDPEIWDKECTNYIPTVYEPQPRPDSSAGKNAPWKYCVDPLVTTGKIEPIQFSSAFVEINQDHLEWMCNWWHSAYDSQQLYNKYPWTALGYTYDWGANPDQKGVGMSEFVALAESQVIFEKMVFPANAFCSTTNSNSDTGNKPDRAPRPKSGRRGNK